MGLRGPKPVDLERLKNEAEHWAALLYALRDGEPERLVAAKWKGRTLSKLEMMLVWARAESGTDPSAKALRQKLLRDIKGKGWITSPAIAAAPNIWEEMKRADSVKEIQKAARRIRRWASQYRPGSIWETRFPDALVAHADKVLSAKQLPNYPKAPEAERPRSDDKRIEFLSKVLAGVMLDIAPITSAKRLSHWHSSKRIVSSLKEKGSV
jgi:hypothetical protein